MSSKWRDRLDHALGFRLALWYALIFLVSSAALVAMTYVLLATALRRYDRELIAAMLVRYASAYAGGGTDALAREIQRSQVGAAREPVFVRALGTRRDVIFLSMPEAWQHFNLSQLRAPALAGEETWATLETGQGDEVLEVASVRLRDGTLFQVGKSTERRVELLSRVRWILLLDLFVVVALGLAGGAVLTWRALRPVRVLTETVRRIMRTGRTDARVPTPDDRDALGQLSVLVNAMLARIDAVVAGMRGALDNVAHDLRTPLTRLRSVAESALPSDNPAVLREALADCLEESDRVVAMLDTLMDISEAETGTMSLNREPTDLALLINQTVDLYEDLAEQRGVTISTDIAGAVEANVDRNRMRQVLANLVDNAVKYTPHGGRIEIAASRREAESVLSVTDTGAGIPADDLPRIWERLYRGDRSRTERGLGLGLSLVKAIVEAHGGRVAVQSTPGAGTRFEIFLSNM